MGRRWGALQPCSGMGVGARGGLGARFGCRGRAGFAGAGRSPGAGWLGRAGRDGGGRRNGGGGLSGGRREFAVAPGGEEFVQRGDEAAESEPEQNFGRSCGEGSVQRGEEAVPCVHG